MGFYKKSNKNDDKDYRITCIVGPTGSGKTSVAQYLALDSVKQGIKCWSNVPLSGAMVLDFDDLMKYQFTKDDEEGVFIIDEAGIDFNNRDWKDMNKNIITFMKLHRHFRIDVYIFSQGEDIDITFRRLSHFWYKLKKIHFLFWTYTLAFPVNTDITINNGKWSIEYELEDNIFLAKWIPIYKVFPYFNSYDVPKFPVKKFEYWPESAGKYLNIFERFGLFFHRVFYFVKNTYNKYVMRVKMHNKIRKNKQDAKDFSNKWNNRRFIINKLDSYILSSLFLISFKFSLFSSSCCSLYFI